MKVVIETLRAEVTRYLRLAGNIYRLDDPTKLALLDRARVLENRVAMLEEQWVARNAVLEGAARMLDEIGTPESEAMAAAIRSVKLPDDGDGPQPAARRDGHTARQPASG